MTASAGAARLSSGMGQGSILLLLIVTGGLVEGLALGILQSWGLKRWRPGLDRMRWIVVTAVVACLGWAGASAPAGLTDPAISVKTESTLHR